MEQWKEYKLGDVATFITNKVDVSLLHKGNYLSTENILPNKSGIKESTSLPTDGKVIAFHKNDILISNIRPYFKKIWLASFDGGCSNDVICVRAKENIQSQFLYYLLSQDTFFDYIMLGAKGTKMPRGDRNQILKWETALPSLDEQIKIAEILSAFDKKTEINKQINSNLEEQAKALFKSWFIEFEPFKGGKFVDSELGRIPEGWKVGHYSDIIDETIGGDWGKDSPIGNYNHKVVCIRGCDFQTIKNGIIGNAPIRYILEKNFEKKSFHENDILVEISGGTQTVSTGRVCYVSQTLINRFKGDIICTNFCRILRPSSRFSAYLYYSWLYKYSHRVMFAFENGTSGIKNFRIKDFIDLEPVLIPPVKVVDRYQQIVDELHKQMQIRGLEMNTLASLRDTLLPKLMSGELAIK